MRFRRATTAVLMAALTTAVAAGCEPPVRLRLEVTSRAAGADGTPGDRVCAAPAAGGECTLQAAVEEANAVGRADIALPGGVYGPNRLTVTGDVAVLGAGVQTVTLSDSVVVVAAGASLRLDGVSSGLHRNETPSWIPPRLDVHGSVHVTRSELAGARDSPLLVRPGGAAVVEDTIIRGQRRAPAWVEGTAIFDRVTFLSAPFAAPHHAQWDGVSHWRAVAARRIDVTGECSGTNPVSHGYNRTATATCGMAGSTDSAGPIGVPWDGQTTLSFVPDPTSPLVDAIPVGTAGCSAGGTDVFGTPRGIDGNGDGVGGCDIGAVERPAAPA